MERRLIRHAGTGLAACLIVLAASQAFAQFTGTFNGRVVDSSGAVLPGVTATVTNMNTGVVRSTVTNSEGLYSLPALESGAYEVKVELAGFGPAIRRNVSLGVGATLTLDFTMQPGAVSETITVTGVAPLIEISKSELNTVINSKEITDLPLVNRSFTSLMTVMPSVRAGAPHDTTKYSQGGMSFSGSQGRNVNATVDGGENRDNVNGGILQSYTLEGIDEFKISDHLFSAAQGRTGGASVTIVTKAGTNQQSGSAFMFGRTGGMAARDYFTAQANLPAAPYHREQFGGSEGGAIIPDRLFYFGAIERIREIQSFTIPPSAYSELQRLVPFGAVAVQQVPDPTYDTLYNGKVSFVLNQKTSGFVRFSGQVSSQLNNQSGTGTRDQSQPPLADNTFYNVVASLTTVVNPQTLNQFTFSALDWFISIDTPSLPGALKNLNFPSTSMGRGPIGETDFQRNFQIKDTLSHQAGAHALQAGVDYKWLPRMGSTLTTFLDGAFTFFDDPSTILTDRVKYPQGFQTPGIVSLYTLQSGIDNVALACPPTTGIHGCSGPQPKQFSAFVQDDWRPKPRLTFNLGLRYDLDVGFMAQSYLPNNPTYQLLTAIGSPFGGLPSTPTKDISPRVGFAYQLTKDAKTVLRGGFGLYYDENDIAAFFRVIGQSNPPYAITQNLTNTAVGVGQLSNYVFGVSPLPAPPANATTLRPGGGALGQWISPDYRNPYMREVHVGVERQLATGLALKVDYAHSDGLHEFRVQDINYIVNGTRILAPQFAAIGQANTLGQIRLYNADGESQFDEMTLKLQGRLPRMTWQLTYELARAYGYGGKVQDIGSFPVNEAAGITGPGEWGPANNDERHRIVLLGSFDLPGGFQIAPIFQFATARPYNLTAGRDLNADGVNNDRYIDPTTGQQVAVNSARGDSSTVLDLRLSKFFSIFGGGKSRVGAFLECFNVFNTANFGNLYAGNARAANFMQPVGLAYGAPGAPRRLQLGARLQF